MVLVLPLPRRNVSGAVVSMILRNIGNIDKYRLVFKIEFVNSFYKGEIKMKVFKVWTDNYDYDEYDSCIVVAESIEEIKQSITYYNSYCIIYEHTPNSIFFKNYQGEIHIKEVDLTKKGIICASFNAG